MNKLITLEEKTNYIIMHPEMYFYLYYLDESTFHEVINKLGNANEIFNFMCQSILGCFAGLVMYDTDILTNKNILCIANGVDKIIEEISKKTNNGEYVDKEYMRIYSLYRRLEELNKNIRIYKTENKKAIIEKLKNILCAKPVKQAEKAEKKIVKNFLKKINHDDDYCIECFEKYIKTEACKIMEEYTTGEDVRFKNLTLPEKYGEVNEQDKNIILCILASPRESRDYYCHMYKFYRDMYRKQKNNLPDKILSYYTSKKNESFFLLNISDKLLNVSDNQYTKEAEIEVATKQMIDYFSHPISMADI